MKRREKKPDLNLRTTVLRGIVVASSSMVSYWLVTSLLVHVYSVSRDDDLLGGMWAAIATIFVCRQSHEESMSAALSRMAATLVSVGLCLAYLLLFPFQVWGMAALIVIGAIVLRMIGRSDDVITASITTVVLMVVAAISPQGAWREPILRTIDTALGAVIGLGAARLLLLGRVLAPASYDQID